MGYKRKQRSFPRMNAVKNTPYCSCYLVKSKPSGYPKNKCIQYYKICGKTKPCKNFEIGLDKLSPKMLES